MGHLIKRYISEMVFVDSLSSTDEIRDITLRVTSEGGGKLLELSNGMQNSTIYLYHPDDLRRIYEAAEQLWAQGELIPGDSVIEGPVFDDEAAAVIRAIV